MRRGLVLVLVVLSECIGAPAARAGVGIEYYRLRSPGGRQDIEQASGLDYGRVGQREGLWLVCDRNGGPSAGRIYFISSSTAAGAVSGKDVVADDELRVVPPKGEWSLFAASHAAVGQEALAELHRRLHAQPDGGGPYLDLEAVAIAPGIGAAHEPRLFVVAEEPVSMVLELSVEADGPRTCARLRAAYLYEESPDHRGWDSNDGLEGLAYTGRPGEFYWAEEGTRSHTDEQKPRLMFQDPRLGRAWLRDGRVIIEGEASDALTRAARAQRKGSMQTLNALATRPSGELLAIDRNGGWILRIDPGRSAACGWLNLYDLGGVNLRELLARFPEERQMPYISIEGMAVDPAGALWLVDDPALPEGWGASCLLRLTGVEVKGKP